MGKKGLIREVPAAAALLLCLGGCGRDALRPPSLPAPLALMGRLPAGTLAALSREGEGEPGPLAGKLLRAFGFRRSEIKTLGRFRAWAAALTRKGRRALLSRPLRAGGTALPQVSGEAGGIGKVYLLPPGGPRLPPPASALAAGRPWQVLARAVRPWKGKLFFWFSLAGVLEPPLSPSRPGGGAGKNSPLSPALFPTAPGSFLLGPRTREVLNLDAFEAVLLRGEEETRGRFALFAWPDRVGLPGILFPGKGGISGGLPPGRGAALAWRIHPPALASVLSGLESLPGVPGRLVEGGVALFQSRTGLDPVRDIPPALDGTLLLQWGPRGGSLQLGLQEGPAGARLRAALLSKGLLKRASTFLGRGGIHLASAGKSLLFSWGKRKPSPFPALRPAPRSGRLGTFRFPTPAGTLEGEFRRAPWGLTGTFRLER